jgi:hypothetical protein
MTTSNRQVNGGLDLAWGAMFDPSLVQPPPPGITLGRIEAALDAARAGAQRRNREQTRELLVAELRARGLMLPPPSVDSPVDLTLKVGHAAAPPPVLGRRYSLWSGSACHREKAAIKALRCWSAP